MKDAARPTYEVIIYWSADDDAFIAEIPELPGCAADGRMPGEALARVQVVACEWVETARELGRPVPQPRGRLQREDRLPNGRAGQ